MLINGVATTKRFSCACLWLKDIFFMYYCQRSGCLDETRRCGYRRGVEGWRTVSRAFTVLILLSLLRREVFPMQLLPKLSP